MSETILELLHENEKLSQKSANKIWSQVCERADGIDVESIRSEWGLHNKPSDRLRTVRNYQWMSKSKLTTKSWDPKQFWFQYILGMKGSQNELMRSGSNNHLVNEVLPKNVDFDEFKILYDSKLSIKPYMKNLAKRIFTKIVDNATKTEIKSFKQALSVYTDSEAANYRNAMDCIAEDYQQRYSALRPYYDFDKIAEYLFPVWREVVLWDYDSWTSGIVDAIFKVPYKNWRPVDYKFGAPKLKYYLKGIGLEMTYYKHLIQGTNVKHAHNYFGKRYKWEPLFCDDGEMWYILDKENKKHHIEYSDTWDVEYYTAVAEYWDDLNNLNYNYPKTYGWKSPRYDDFCMKIENGEHDCEYYHFCKDTTTFKMANDPMWKDIFGDA